MHFIEMHKKNFVFVFYAGLRLYVFVTQVFIFVQFFLITALILNKPGQYSNLIIEKSRFTPP